MSGGGQEQKQTTQPGSAVRDYRDYVFRQAQGLPQWSPYGGQTVADPSQQTMQAYQMMGQIDPRMTQAYGGMLGNLGLATQHMAGQLGGAGSFTGADMEAYQNPYQQQVIQQTQQDYDRMRGQGLRNVGEEATRAGAYGGARHGIAEGTRMAELGRAEANQLAGLRHTGFQDAASRWSQDRSYQNLAAQQMANLGMSGAAGLNALQQQRAQAMMGAGEYGRGIQQQGLTDQYNQWLMGQQAPYQRLAALQQGFGAPTGQETTIDYGGGGLGGFLGGAMSGAGAGAALGPWGALGGGILGGLSGLF